MTMRLRRLVCERRNMPYYLNSSAGRKGRRPMRELADAMVMDRSALGHNLRPLERDGLIALEESKEDRRRCHVVETAQGRAEHRKANRHWQTAQGRFEEVYGKHISSESPQ